MFKKLRFLVWLVPPLHVHAPLKQCENVSVPHDELLLLLLLLLWMGQRLSAMLQFNCYFPFDLICHLSGTIAKNELNVCRTGDQRLEGNNFLGTSFWFKRDNCYVAMCHWKSRNGWWRLMNSINWQVSSSIRWSFFFSHSSINCSQNWIFRSSVFRLWFWIESMWPCQSHTKKPICISNIILILLKILSMVPCSYVAFDSFYFVLCPLIKCFSPFFPIWIENLKSVSHFSA